MLGWWQYSKEKYKINGATNGHTLSYSLKRNGARVRGGIHVYLLVLHSAFSTKHTERERELGDPRG